MPRNLFLNVKYQKYIDIKNGDDGLEFDANMLDAINLNLNYTRSDVC